MKKILVTSTDMMMMQFLVPHVQYLREQGYDVEVACSEVGNRFEEVQKVLGEDKSYKVRLQRNPVKPSNLKGLSDLKKIINNGSYDLIWTNEPVMGIMTRLAAKRARKKGTRVMYMTHGYHFFKGGQAKYKLFYPIEKWASRYCDAIVTINWEDYQLSKEKFHAKIVEHIDGIGLDTKKFGTPTDAVKKREELEISSDSFVVLSVGELKPHKNHKTVIEAIGLLKDENIVYLICGKGELLERFQMRVKQLGIEHKVKFLGYRKDVHEIMQCSDCFVFPSKREGLGLASLEAMAAGLPIIGANTRGIVDYVFDGETGYLCGVETPQDYADAIERLYRDREQLEKISKNCIAISEKYDINIIQRQVEKIVKRVLGGK
jgi:glycosyltransferase EpsD